MHAQDDYFQSGETRLRVPRRLNTLSARDQEAVGRAFATHLGVPLRGEAESGA